MYNNSEVLCSLSSGRIGHCKEASSCAKWTEENFKLLFVNLVYVYQVVVGAHTSHKSHTSLQQLTSCCRIYSLPRVWFAVQVCFYTLVGIFFKLSLFAS